MAHHYNSGILFMQLNYLITFSHLSRIISSAVQKVKKNLYIDVQFCSNDSIVENDLQSFNKFANQIYIMSSNNCCQVDTRLILQGFRDKLICEDCGQSKINTSHAIDLVLNYGSGDSSAKQLSNVNHNLVTEKIPLFDETNLIDDEQSHESTYSIKNLAPASKIYQNVVLGGTFDRLHAGHKMLLTAAVLRCKKCLTIGVTDGKMIQSKKLWELIEPCEIRMKNLRDFLMDIEPRLEYCIVPITDPFGPTSSDPELELLVVSEETINGGLKVNELREEKGLPILDIHPISLIGDTQAIKHEEEKVSSSSLRQRLLGSHLKPAKSLARPFIIGLTGGIASGKTTISKRLKNLGARIIPCDELGHLAYRKGSQCYQQIIENFGDAILDSNQEIDRQKLGPIVFSDKAQLDKLNSLVWPEIRRLFQEEIQTFKNENYDGVVILDAAILLEAGWDQDCHEVWVSIIPASEAVKRISARDKLSPEQATKRIESQLSNSDRVKKANVVLCSIWEPEVTGLQVQKAWNSVQQFLKQNFEVK